jgi:DNA-directed RNA polymerase specialized sigma24 family protein
MISLSHLDPAELSRIVGSSDKAQEALCCALLKTVERRGEFKNAQHARAYCLQTAYYRKNHGTGSRVRVASLIEEVAESTSTLRGHRKDALTRNRKTLAACIRLVRNGLGTNAALPWALVRVEGKRSDQVAENLGISLRSVQRRVRAAETYLAGLGWQKVEQSMA